MCEGFTLVACQLSRSIIGLAGCLGTETETETFGSGMQRRLLVYNAGIGNVSVGASETLQVRMSRSYLVSLCSAIFHCKQPWIFFNVQKAWQSSAGNVLIVGISRLATRYGAVDLGLVVDVICARQG